MRNFIKSVVDRINHVFVNVEKPAPLPPNRLDLVSPSGKRRITLLADDLVSGLWVAGEENEPLVAIYLTEHQGAVVGVYGTKEAGKVRGSLDSCLGHSAEKGGFVMLADKAGGIHWLDGAKIGQAEDVG